MTSACTGKTSEPQVTEGGAGVPAVPMSGSSPHSTSKLPAVRTPPDSQGRAWLRMSPGAQPPCVAPLGPPGLPGPPGSICGYGGLVVCGFSLFGFFGFLKEVVLLIRPVRVHGRRRKGSVIDHGQELPYPSADYP